MNVLLVDYLACPRCGPAFGLVLLARELQDRRVRTGLLGCPNCRDEFPVKDGFGDLRPPFRRPPAQTAESAAHPATPSRSAPRDLPLRIAAALGVTEGPGVIVMSASHVGAAEALARAAPAFEVAVVGSPARGSAGASPLSVGVSPMAVGETLPFRSGVLRGVARAANDAIPSPAETARVLAPGARVVVTGADFGTRAVWEKAGLRTVADDGETIVLAST